jgi:Ca-activated chloride channel family protein
MDPTMVKLIPTSWLSFFADEKTHHGVKFNFLSKKSLIVTLLLTGSLFAYIKPQQFTDLWLTRDQQGQLLFNLGHYQQASSLFKSTQWQAFSSYGAEQYKNSATLYSQFNDIDNQVAQANALAHGREYIKARNLYQKILTVEPANLAATSNIKIVQAIIDEVNRLSASQKAEDGEAIKELGDDPQTGDGAEREEAPKEQEIEQLSAEQLLLDPSLNDMWLRQVQKNPANFLSQKFYMQQEASTTNNTKSNNKGVDNE